MTEYTALANYQAVKNEDLIVVKQRACGTLLEVKDANQLCESKPSGLFTPVMACIRCVQQLAQFHSHHSVKTINICSTVYSPRARLLYLSLSILLSAMFIGLQCGSKNQTPVGFQIILTNVGQYQ